MKKLNKDDRILFDKIIEDATVDCNSEDEQITGWACIFEENISPPCNCIIGKEKREQAVLEKIEQDGCSNSILGIIKLGKIKIRIPIEDITLEDSKKMKYINAYKYWR